MLATKISIFFASFRSAGSTLSQRNLFSHQRPIVQAEAEAKVDGKALKHARAGLGLAFLVEVLRWAKFGVFWACSPPVLAQSKEMERHLGFLAAEGHQLPRLA